MGGSESSGGGGGSGRLVGFVCCDDGASGSTSLSTRACFATIAGAGADDEGLLLLATLPLELGCEAEGCDAESCDEEGCDEASGFTMGSISSSAA